MLQGAVCDIAELRIIYQIEDSNVKVLVGEGEKIRTKIGAFNSVLEGEKNASYVFSSCHFVSIIYMFLMVGIRASISLCGQRREMKSLQRVIQIT